MRVFPISKNRKEKRTQKRKDAKDRKEKPLRSLCVSASLREVFYFLGKELVLVLTVLWASPTFAQVFSTQQQALERIFPKPQTIERQTLFLDDKQVAAIQKLARAKLESKIVIYYAGKKDSNVTGYAFFATDIVRTKEATYMTVVNPDSTIRLVEILAFYEPMDYFPAPRWLELFRGKWLSDNLWPKRDIHNITGATLTAQVITQGARRTLAIFQVAIPKTTSPVN